MPENQPPHENPEAHQSRVEYEPSKYPDRVSGFAMPSLDNHTTEVEIVDSLDEKQRVLVPNEAVLRLGMPRVEVELPAVAKEAFEAGIGLALIACLLKTIRVS